MSETFGKYNIVKKLATGGMAEVFLARATGPMGFEKTVVLKRILPALAEDPSFVELFLTEARLVAGLNHPNVAQVYDFGEVGGRWFLAMEYVDGPTLRQLKKRAQDLKVSLPVHVVLRIIAQACEGLHYAHEATAPKTGKPLGLVHRDVSPDNLILSRVGGVKVLDFGIVKATGPESTQTGSGTVRGKIGYMSPEQLGAEPLDRRADVWSLGMVLYELLTFARPFTATGDTAIVKAILTAQFVPVRKLRPDVPAAVETILERCFSKEREGRFSSCRELQLALEQVLTESSLSVGAIDIEQVLVSLHEGRSLEDPLATPSEPRPSAPARGLPRALLVGVGLLALAAAGAAATISVLSASQRAPEQVLLPSAPPPVVTLETIDAGPAEPAEPAAPPEPVVVAETTPDAGPRAVVRPARPQSVVRVDIRVLPEGDARVGGEVVSAVEVRPGRLTVRFENRRFGQSSRTLTVPPCEGVFRIGYTFTSDRLTSRCVR